MLIAAIGAAAGAAGLAAWAVRGKSSQLLAPAVWRGPRDAAGFALTFDDGPSESTPRLLNILARHNARATFFVCGANVRRLPSVAREIVAAGHEIACHGDVHPYYHFRGAAFLRRDIGGGMDAIQTATGITPRWFRPPYGIRWFGMRPVLRELHLELAMWTVIGRDWKLPASEIAAAIRPELRPGAIVCLHDGRILTANPNIDNTLDATRQILEVAPPAFTLSRLFVSPWE
ncbi:MAG: polysaccharide deacetylase family protein [Bryobacteraceae bacterium]|nr:polysaccharide deacetylase family protein [Bryobacteraceae bacterium]